MGGHELLAADLLGLRGDERASGLALDELDGGGAPGGMQAKLIDDQRGEVLQLVDVRGLEVPGDRVENAEAAQPEPRLQG